MKPSLVDLISPRCKKLAVWTAAGCLFYTVLGFFLLPPIVRVIGVKQLSTHLDRPVTIQKVRLNPYRLSATMRGLLIKDKDGAPLVSWDEAYVNFQLASLFTRAWVFKEVSLSQPYVRVRVNEDCTLNFSDIVARLSPTIPSQSNEPGKHRLWRINRLRLTGAKASFIDRSLQPNVNITLEQLNGTVSGLSSDDPKRADVQIQGTVDKTARAEITGKINPWNSKQPMDVKIALKEMDLLPEDPYSGKYLGCRLKKGKLSAQLSYQVTERKLKSESHLTLDHLTLGQKVESADATRLPVRLAIAFLKDRDGRIALEIPVNGSLDDPQFNMGKVVYRALETVLTRIVTSPFSALGALFGGKGEELSFQEFQPGSTNLLPAAIAKLDVLAKGLYACPDLQLEIEGSTDAQTDLEALRREKLNQQLAVQQWNAPPLTTATNGAGTESLPAQGPGKASAFDKGASALSSPVAYSSAIPIKSTLTEDNPIQSPFRAFADDKGATALILIFAPAAVATDPDWERALLEAVEIPPDALPTLAVGRARNVRAYLLQTGKVEPQRITESARGTSSKGSRVYVWLQ